MGLRTRIGFAFLVLVVLLAGVGLLAMRNNRRVGRMAQQLRSGPVLDVGHGDLVGTGVEIQGDWDPSAGFRADAILRLPEPRRPKLRGRIDGIDLERGILRMYGVDLRVHPGTEFIGAAEPGLRFLRAGDRAEVSARIDVEDRWIARKIARTNIKESDKIKGTVTWAHIDGEDLDSLAVNGIPVHFQAGRRGRSGPLAQVTRATAMEFALLEMRSAAGELLQPEPASDMAPSEAERADGAPAPGAMARLQRAHAAFHVQAAGYADLPAEGEVADWAASLRSRLPELEGTTERFVAAIRSRPDEARRLFEHELEPLLARQLLPLLRALRGSAQENLEDEVRAIETEAASTNRLFVRSSLVALVAALLLTGVVWRSVAQPLRTLHDAALAIGKARFDTRVPVLGGDELAVLATAFNTMAEKLAESTVSLAHMKRVLDSMAAPLMLVDARGRITEANRAAARLLGYEPEAFIGKTWSELQSGDGQATPRWDPESLLAAGDNLLRHRDGRLVPVSFAAAALGEGPASGFVCVALDRTAARQTEEQLRRSLLEKEFLLREVHHRVKNNLQVISSFLDLQSSNESDSVVRAQFEELQNRIRTMALIHEQLCRGSALDRVDIAAYLERLVRRIVDSSAAGTAVHATVDAARLEMDMDRAMICGLVVNELVSNALKHAFPERQTGTIRVRLDERDGRAVLEVGDDGRGLPEGFTVAGSRSLGLTLVRLMAAQLGGELASESGAGTRVTIRFPVPAPGAVQSA